LLALVLFMIFLISRWFTRRIEIRYHAAIEHIEEGSLRLISAASIWRALHIAFRIFGLFAAVACSLFTFTSSSVSFPGRAAMRTVSGRWCWRPCSRCWVQC